MRYLFIILVLASCARENPCPENYVMEIRNANYLTCDPNDETFTFEQTTTFVEFDNKCECESNARKLEDSFWDIVEAEPTETKFMYYEVSPSYTCYKK
mgnify:CR=1 FL=1